MESARSVGQAFSPLDEELALLPGALTPSLQEDLVRLGAWMPFGRAAQELQHFRGVAVSRPTAERLTEAAGAAYVAFQTAEVARIEQELPAPPAGPVKQLLSVDGAMVPLVGGEWAEVRTLVIGEVPPPVMRKGEAIIRTTNLSYLSRLADAASFQRLALVETQRRGVETAQAVAAVTDGAEWIPKFLDFHRHDAVRILDFPHAGEHLNAVGQAVWGEGSEQSQNWLAGQLHSLKHEGPGPVLAEVRRLASLEPKAVIASNLCYLEKRADQLQYPAFLAAGWPIGDGAVESANKLVVEARLKGSGMHWARPHVDPMLALRNIVCSDRWGEAWPQIIHTLRQQARQRQTARRQKRRQSALALSAATSGQPQVLPSLAPAAPPSTADKTATQPGPNSAAKTPTPDEPWRPAPNHPWRRMPIGRARFKPPLSQTDAKT